MQVESITLRNISFAALTEKNYSETDLSFFSFSPSCIAFWARMLIEQNPFQYKEQVSIQGIIFLSVLDLSGMDGSLLINGQNFVICVLSPFFRIPDGSLVLTV